jgi:hypothetical protein
LSRTRQIIEQQEIEINGKVFGLYLDLAAMKDFERLTGRGVLQFLKPVFDAVRASAMTSDTSELKETGLSLIGEMIDRNAITASDMTALLWACLGGEDSGLTEREVGRLVTVSNIKEVALKLFDVVKSILPKATDEGAGDGESEAGNPSQPTG